MGGLMAEVASRGCFTRQPVNVASLEALTKVRPVRLPVSSRQVTRQVSGCSPHVMTPPSLKPKFRVVGCSKFHALELLPGNMAIEITYVPSCRNRTVHVCGQVWQDGTVRKWKSVTAVDCRPGTAFMPDGRACVQDSVRRRLWRQGYQAHAHGLGYHRHVDVCRSQTRHIRQR
jgi:hypothetical protein